jgi:diguanylate cyclase (GGDEF)-like protein
MRTHRIALAVLALVAVLVVAVSVDRVMADARTALSQEIQQSERLAVSERANALGDSLEVATERIHITARYPIVQLAVESHQSALLQGALDTAKSSPGVSGGAVITRDGEVLAKQGHVVDLVPRPGAVFRSSPDRTNAYVTIAAPVPGSDGTTAGWVIQEFTVRRLVPQFTRGVPYMRGITSLVTRDGTVVMSTYANSSPRVSVPEELALVKAGRTASATVHSPRLDADRLLSIAPVHGTNLVAIVGADRATANEPASALVWKLLTVLAITLIVCGLLTFAGVLVLDRSRRRLVRERLAAELLANTDALTSLDNRRGFDSAVQRRRTMAGTTAVVLADLDNLKIINDSLGHDAGDEALRQAGLAIRSAVRPGDVAARLGGDEFAILLPDASVERARLVAERVRDAVAAVHVDGFGLLSISTGVAARPNDTLLGALTEADADLYAAKRVGRVPSWHARLRYVIERHGLASTD